MIDIHTHLHPPKLFRAIRKWFSENSSWKLTYPTQPADVAAHLRNCGVTRFVFCSYAHKAGIAEEINNWLIQTSNELGRFGVPLATVHPSDGNYIEYYEMALDNGCVGLKIHEDVQKLSINDAALDPILEISSRHGAFVLVHVGSIPWTSHSNDGPQRLRTVLGRYPSLSIIVAHMGVPDTAQYLQIAEDHPNLYLDTTMTLAPESPFYSPIAGDIFEAHADRLIYGSDFPNIPYSYEQDIRAIEELSSNPRVRQAVFEDNAGKLLLKQEARHKR